MRLCFWSHNSNSRCSTEDANKITHKCTQILYLFLRATKVQQQTVRKAFNRCTKEYLLNRILAFKVATKFNCRFHLILCALRMKPFPFLINCFFFRSTISLPKGVNSSARIYTVVVRRRRLDDAAVAASLKYVGHSGVHRNYHGMLLDQPWLRLNRF